MPESIPESGAAEPLGPGAVAPGPTVPPAPGSDLAPGRAERKVERAATLTLSTPPDRVREVADGVIAVTDRHRGIVVSSNVTEASGAESVAVIEIAVPSERLQQAIRDLSELAMVESRTESSLDITNAFDAPRQRLRDARDARRSLLRQLELASSAEEVERLRGRLRTVDRRIDSARAELRDLRQRAELARATVTVRGNGDAESGWTPGDALDDGLAVLRVLAGVAIVAAAILLPAALLVAIALLVARGLRRHRRERALDESS